MIDVHQLTRDECKLLYYHIIKENDKKTIADLAKRDLFFLLTEILNRVDVDHPWLYERVREWEADKNGHLDLWARGHYKSTIITYGGSIQEIINDPEVTICIFSHTRPIAKGFLSQIKRELEMNEVLKDLYPDILFKNPAKEAVRWSLDDGIVVKRKSNPKESTVEAWGVVDGQPTSKHFRILLYDDLVTLSSVTTPEQIAKTTDAFRLSLNLGFTEGCIKRAIGTYYHFNDTWRTLVKEGVFKARIHAATKDGKIDGEPVYLTPETLREKLQEMGPYVSSCQLFLNPVADRAMGFALEWMRHYDFLRNCDGWNYYLLVDPAGEKKKSSDYTVMVVIGLAPDNNYYLVDGIRDRMNLVEKTKTLFRLHRKWNPTATGYEKYGMQSDIEHIKYVMEIENYRFTIIPLGGPMAKEDRIRRLVPIFHAGRFWLPHQLFFVDYEKKAKDFVKDFLEEEFTAFPVATHDDMLDCMARIVDPELGAVFPKLDTTIKTGAIVFEKDKRVLQSDYDLFAGLGR